MSNDDLQILTVLLHEHPTVKISRLSGDKSHLKKVGWTYFQSCNLSTSISGTFSYSSDKSVRCSSISLCIQYFVEDKLDSLSVLRRVGIITFGVNDDGYNK